MEKPKVSRLYHEKLDLTTWNKVANTWRRAEQKTQEGILPMGQPVNKRCVSCGRVGEIGNSCLIDLCTIRGSFLQWMKNREVHRVCLCGRESVLTG
jgi:hypothetical protein